MSESVVVDSGGAFFTCEWKGERTRTANMAQFLVVLHLLLARIDDCDVPNTVSN